MWARLVGYAVGVLGAACLWLLLAGSPASADDAPAPRDRGPVGAATGAVSDTVRTTVERAVRPARHVAPEPVRRLVDATADTATASVDRVGSTVASAVDRPVARATEQVRDTLSTASDQVAAPDAPKPAPEATTSPRSQELERRLPGRGDGRLHSQRSAADASPADVDRPAATAPVRVVDLVPQEAHAEPGSSGPWIGEAEPDGSATTPGSGGAGPVAEAVDRVVQAVPRGVAVVGAPRDRAVPSPVSSPGFSPD